MNCRLPAYNDGYERFRIVGNRSEAPGRYPREHLPLAERFFWTSRRYFVASDLFTFDYIAQGRTSRGWQAALDFSNTDEIQSNHAAAIT